MDRPGEEIASQRCWELLGTTSIGCLALSVQALPVILPVQYYLTGHRLTVCLGHRAIPERSLNDAIIAFTADVIDTASKSGWSVQIQGRSSIRREGGLGPPCGLPAAEQVVEIETGTITGHYVRLCPFIDVRTLKPRASE